MKSVEPKVYLIASPTIDWDEVSKYLVSIGGEEWLGTVHNDHDGENLTEIGGRLCYKSWKIGLNKNVTRIRKDQQAYFINLLSSGHGSVLEHANYTFILQNVSRVFTHELVRHRVGVAISQESLRYVRSDELRGWLPEEIANDEYARGLMELQMDEAQLRSEILSTYFDLDNPKMPFETKKKITSAMRRMMPQGMATDLQWTANVRTLRHCLEMRTVEGAEVEMRVVFDQIGEIMQRKCPLLFGDYEVVDGAWTTENKKV